MEWLAGSKFRGRVMMQSEGSNTRVHRRVIDRFVKNFQG